MDQSNDWVAFLKAAQEIEKEYHREIDKNALLTQKLKEISKEYEDLNRVYLEEKRKLAELREETEKLKSLYPIYDLFKAKEAEVTRVKKALSQVQKGHPEWDAIDAMVTAHVSELNELRSILQKAERRFEVQLEKVSPKRFDRIPEH